MGRAKASAPAALKDLPSVDEVLRTAGGQAVANAAGSKHTAGMARAVVGGLRDWLRADASSRVSQEDLLREAETMLTERWGHEQRAGISRVINASGVIIHTNLGRAP